MTSQKKILISLPYDLVKDVDSLVDAGFYKTRSDLIYDGLMCILPLKKLVEERQSKRLTELLLKATDLTRHTEKS